MVEIWKMLGRWRNSAEFRFLPEALRRPPQGVEPPDCSHQVNRSAPSSILVHFPNADLSRVGSSEVSSTWDWSAYESML